MDEFDFRGYLMDLYFRGDLEEWLGWSRTTILFLLRSRGKKKGAAALSAAALSAVALSAAALTAATLSAAALSVRLDQGTLERSLQG